MNKLLENGTPLDKFCSTKEADEGLNLDKSAHKKLSDELSINSVQVICHHSSFNVHESRGETKESKNKETKCCSVIKQHKVLVWVERVLLFSICTAVAGAFTVPVIVYYASMDRGNHTATRFSSDLDFDDCTNTAAYVQVRK